MRKFSSVSPFSQVTSPTSLTALGRTSRTSWAIIPRHKTLQQVESGKDLSGENPPRPTSERNTDSHRPQGKSWQIDAYPFSAFALIYKHLKQRRNFEPCITIGLSGSAFSLLFLETRCQMLDGQPKCFVVAAAVLRKPCHDPPLLWTHCARCGMQGGDGIVNGESWPIQAILLRVRTDEAMVFCSSPNHQFPGTAQCLADV